MKKTLATLSSLFALSLLNAAHIQKPTQPQPDFSLDDFRNPTAMFRPVPFWSWNEVMEPEQVKRQVREMKKAGWGGAFVHSRVGLVTPYLGREWFDAVDATIEECQKQGMKVWLYDEDKWPSGFNGGTVTLENEDFRIKTLFARKVGDPVPEGAVKMGVASDGIQVYKYVAPLGEGWFNGTSYSDTMSKAAMDKFRSEAYESYYKRYKKYYGDLIVAEFTDEPCQNYPTKNQTVSGSVAFSSDLVEAFKKMHSYDPTDHFYKLFADVKGAQQFRLQYYRTIDSLFENNFWKNIGDWCAERGIAMTGHCMAETPMAYSQNWSGRVMPFYRHQGIPGIDHLVRSIREPLAAKQCSSVVNQYDKRRMLSELYGCSGGSLSFEDRKWIALEQICLGVNLLNPHLSLYSMTGCRKRDYPQNIFYQQEWWDLNKYVDEPLSRMCYALSNGKYLADILVIHPHESVQANLCATPNMAANMSKESMAIAQKLSAGLDEVLGAILNSQMTFDFGDEQLLEEDGFLKDDKIGIGKMSYGIVVLPQMTTMRPATFARLKEFQANGGKILRVGDPVSMLDGKPNAELAQWSKDIKHVSCDKLAAEVESIMPAAVKIAKTTSGDPSKIWTHIRQMPDGTRFVMLVNLSRQKAFSGEVALRGGFTRAKKYDTNSAEVIDVYTRQDGADIVYPLSLDVADAVLLRLEQGVSPIRAPQVTSVFAEQELKNLSAEAIGDNSLTLDYATFECLKVGEKSTGALPVIEIQKYLNNWKYDGGLKLVYPFKVAGLEKNRQVRLVMEYPDRCEVKINGEVVEYDGLPAWRDFRWLPIDISKYIVQGDNKIELTYKDFKHGDPTIVSPAFDRYGTEIESVYLVGDFSVSAIATGERPVQEAVKRFGLNEPKVEVLKRDSLALCPPRAIEKNLGDVSMQGLPFFTGRIKYSTSLQNLVVPNGARVILEVDNIDCPAAEVIVNGTRAGVLMAHPLQVDITDCMAGNITNIDIVLCASLRNLLGPHHNRQGELISCGPSDFSSKKIPPTMNLAEQHAFLDKWGRGEWQPSDWNDGYCVHSLGEIGKVRLKMIKK